jgi:iron(III) transport system substrate-binding protein
VKSIRFGTTLALTSLIALAGLAGCSSASDSDASANPLTIYSGRNEALVKPLIDKFTEETGIQAEVRYGDSAELSAQIAEEGSNTPAQVFFSQDAGALGALQNLGALAPLPASVATTVPAAYRSTDWTGVSGRARTIVYDPAKFANPPTSVFDLTNAKYKGEVGIAPTNASFQSFVTGMRVTSGDGKTEEWLKGIMANDPQIFDSNLKIVQAVDAGTTGVGLVNHYYWYVNAREKGGADKVKVAQEFTKPGDPGSLINVAGAALTAGNATNANATKFIEYLLSTPSQEYFATKTFEYPLIPGLAGPEGAPPLSSVGTPPVELNDLSDLAGTQALMREAGMLA